MATDLSEVLCQWYRVFGTHEAEPDPGRLLEYFHDKGVPLTGHFRGDDQGWFEVDLVFAPGAEEVHVDRFVSTEEGIRGELNAWAAWLETLEDNPHACRLMERVTQTRQVFTFSRPAAGDDEEATDPLGIELCRFLARETGGVYQVDGLGFFTADGTLLVPE
jgi:hypothetical protein